MSTAILSTSCISPCSLRPSGVGRAGTAPLAGFSGRGVAVLTTSPAGSPRRLVRTCADGDARPHDRSLKHRRRPGLVPGQLKPRDLHRSAVQSSLRVDEDVQGPAVTSQPLLGSTWQVTLDVGRERNTWMPQQWAVSGRRVEIPMALYFAADGAVNCLGIGAFMSELKVGSGEWAMDNGTLRFSVEISGFERGDVSLPAGKVHFSIPAWGSILSSKGGNLTIRQRRWVVRRESRMVGRFKAAPLDTSLPNPAASLPPVRVSQGTWDGRVYEKAPTPPQ